MLVIVVGYLFYFELLDCDGVHISRVAALVDSASLVVGRVKRVYAPKQQKQEQGCWFRERWKLIDWHCNIYINISRQYQSWAISVIHPRCYMQAS